MKISVAQVPKKKKPSELEVLQEHYRRLQLELETSREYRRRLQGELQTACAQLEEQRKMVLTLAHHAGVSFSSGNSADFVVILEATRERFDDLHKDVMGNISKCWSDE